MAIIFPLELAAIASLLALFIYVIIILYNYIKNIGSIHDRNIKILKYLLSNGNSAFQLAIMEDLNLTIPAYKKSISFLKENSLIRTTTHKVIITSSGKKLITETEK